MTPRQMSGHSATGKPLGKALSDRQLRRKMAQQLELIDGIERRRIVAGLSRERLCARAFLATRTYDRVLAGAVLARPTTLKRLTAALKEL